MQGVKLISVSTIEEPEKQFLVCDLADGNTFADPLLLYENPSYDLYNVNEKGLYAIGGELNLENLLSSYKYGIFPWFAFRENEEPYWYCPRQRFVIFPEAIHASHSIRNLLNKGKYRITINKSFREVIHNCRIVNGREEDYYAWLGDRIESLFIHLNEIGFAKSVEVWEEENLIGGFYGFWYKGVFQGESMFSLRPSSSQVGLVLLCRNPYIEGDKIKIIDTQFETPTFKRLGGEYIPYKEYRYIMNKEK